MDRINQAKLIMKRENPDYVIKEVRSCEKGLVLVGRQTGEVDPDFGVPVLLNDSEDIVYVNPSDPKVAAVLDASRPVRS